MSQTHRVDVPWGWASSVLRAVMQPLRHIGAWCIATWRGVTGTIGVGVAVLVQAWRPATWRRTVRAELVRNCVQVALYGLPAIIITGLLVGLGMVNQVLYWLRLARQEGLIGQFLALGLVREIAPVLVGVLVLGRSGSTMMVELGAMRTSGQVTSSMPC